VGRVVHFEIHCDDVNRAEAFYRDVFGWTIQRWEGPVDYRLIMTGPGDQAGIDGALVERRHPIVGEAVIAFVNTIQVDDIAGTEQRVSEAGGRQVVDRHEIPGVGQLSYFKDTEGNIFGAMQSAPD
jgi:predicted enzyme related to lactoylglutathione lyase